MSGARTNVGEGFLSQIHEAEESLLAELRKMRRVARATAGIDADPSQALTPGQKIADAVISLAPVYRNGDDMLRSRIASISQLSSNDLKNA